MRKEVLSEYGAYGSSESPHIKELNDTFTMDNLSVCPQRDGGRTFEDELFLDNYRTDEADRGSRDVGLFQIAANNTILKLLELYGLDFSK